jgi:hypothetical protein
MDWSMEATHMTRFLDWKEAHTEAQKRANEVGTDVAIRKVKEYGKIGYNISFASHNDSDYALAEIVKPAKCPWCGQSDKCTPHCRSQYTNGQREQELQ